LVRQPHLAPLAVLAAPERADLPLILTGALGGQTEAVDRHLHRHHLAPRRLVPALDRVDLARERIETEAVAGVEEQLELVVGRALADGALDQVDLLLGQARAHDDGAGAAGLLECGGLAHRVSFSSWRRGEKTVRTRRPCSTLTVCTPLPSRSAVAFGCMSA